MENQEYQSFQDKFKLDYDLIAQQMSARLVDICDDEPDALEARYAYFNKIGKITPRLKQGFAGPTPNMSPAHTRRQASVVTYEWGDVFDETQLRTLIANPQSKHKMAAVAGFYRMMDLTIINAALGNAIDYNDDGTTTSTALPASQLVAHASAGLTVDKVLEAGRLFDAAEVDEVVKNKRRVFVASSKQMKNMLSLTQPTSSDYVEVKALVEGKITHFGGFDFIRSELLPVDGSGRRRCIALAQGAVGIHMQMQPTVKIGPDPGASFAERIYMTQNLGATRLEDVRTVEVPCVES